MANTQQFSLRWNNYLNHITGAFDALRADEDLVDVTLSCEGRKIKAHKMLLSACSSYFREIFKENPCQHPVIIFWNVKYDDLEALITFMYQGEVNVAQECLSSFLNAAELLEIQGLTSGTTKETCDSKNDESDTVLAGNEIRRAKKHLIQKNISPVLHIPDSPPGKKKKQMLPSDASPTNSSDSKLLDHSFKVEPEYYDNDSAETYDDPNPFNENLPQDTSIEQKYTVGPNEDSTEGLSNLDRGPGTSSDSLQDSLQVFAHGLWRRLHPSLKQFGCDECGKVFKHPRSLDHHKKMHEGRTTCPVCRKVFGRMYALRLHMSSSHPNHSELVLQKAK